MFGRYHHTGLDCSLDVESKEESGREYVPRFVSWAIGWIIRMFIEIGTLREAQV